MIVYSLTKKELSKKINDKDFWLKSRLPITPYRLYSQINSPLADDRDICLIIALDSQNEIKGFIGILPDSIFIDNNRTGEYKLEFSNVNGEESNLEWLQEIEQDENRNSEFRKNYINPR